MSFKGHLVQSVTLQQNPSLKLFPSQTGEYCSASNSPNLLSFLLFSLHKMGSTSEPHFSIPKPFQTTQSAQEPHILPIFQTEQCPCGHSHSNSATGKH